MRRSDRFPRTGREKLTADQIREVDSLSKQG